MFRGRERLVELGHIGVGVIADVAKPVVPDLLRLADEVVFIVLAEQAVGARMLLRSIYNALDLNSHFKLFQLVSRRGFGLAGDLDDRADRPQAVHRDEIPLPAVVLPRDVGLLPGVRVGVRGDKGKIVIGFDKLISLELELIRPLCFIFPDVRAFLLDFLVSVGVAAQREIFLCRILPAVGVRTSLYTLNENRTALIQRGLAGLGGGVALDLDDRAMSLISSHLPFFHCHLNSMLSFGSVSVWVLPLS